MIKGVGHVAIVVKDLEKSISFYRDVLGFPVVRTFIQPDWLGGGKIIDMSLDPRQVGEIQLVKYPENSVLPGGAGIGLEHVGLLIDDMDTTYSHLRNKGVTDFVHEPTPKVPGLPRVARLRDPNGVLLELITFVPRQ